MYQNSADAAVTQAKAAVDSVFDRRKRDYVRGLMALFRECTEITSAQSAAMYSVIRGTNNLVIIEIDEESLMGWNRL